MGGKGRKKVGTGHDKMKGGYRGFGLVECREAIFGDRKSVV